MSLHRDAGGPGTLPLSFLHRLLCGTSPKQWAQSTSLKESLCRCLTTGRGSQGTRREWQLRRGGALAEGMSLETIAALGLGQGISQGTVTQNVFSGAASEAVGCLRGRGFEGRGLEHALEGRAL